MKLFAELPLEISKYVFIIQESSSGSKAFNIFKFVDYNEILGITPNGAKVFFKYLPEAKHAVMIVP